MHYFQAQPIAIYTEFLLKNILSKATLSGRLSKWVVELGQIDIKFLPRATIKRQVFDDFVAEFSPRDVSPEQGSLASTHKREESSGAKSAVTQPTKKQSTRENHEAIKEPSTIAEAANTEEITEVPEVIIEPPQVDPNSTWKMFVDGAKNSLGWGQGQV